MKDARAGDIDLTTIRFEPPGYVELVFSTVILWGFADAGSTLVAVRSVGPGGEANPWIRVLLTHHPMLMVALKAAVVLYVGVVLLECRPVVERVPYWRGWFLGILALGVWIVLTNLYVGLSVLA
ncbi:MAG: DUF5658 family protein [Haloarculaceae archaeon]